MIDEMVLAAQKWVNATYSGVSGYIKCAEDGSTGQQTVNSLIMGLQKELGITPVVPNFGAGTQTALDRFGTVSVNTANKNVVTLTQAALYCKGYEGGGITGTWSSKTTDGVKNLQADIGLTGTAVTGAVNTKLFKALLTTDAQVLVTGGSALIRQVQQWLNTKYINRKNFFYVPTDGRFSRGVSTALLYAIQYEEGLDDATANGFFGPTTQAGLKTAQAKIVVGSSDSTKAFVRLFKAALIFNGYPLTFDGAFTSADSTIVKTFQRFSAFVGTDQTGVGDFRTWAELLVSTGDPARVGTALDCASTITAPRAAAIKAAGYSIVGRYITNQPDVTQFLDKKIKPGELDTIFQAGLSLFPIFEEGGFYNYFSDGRDPVIYFTREQGLKDGKKAHDAGKGYGLPDGTIIYWAVDTDATDAGIAQNVIPYFEGVQIALNRANSQYAVGVYGTRNVCTQVSSKGLAISSFISGLSTGWSGNLGYRLPPNWAFNQIQTVTLATGTTGQIEIDKNATSGRYKGINTVLHGFDPNEGFFDYLDWLQDQARAFKASGKAAGTTESFLVAQYMRYPEFESKEWLVFAGPVAIEFVDYVNAKGIPRPSNFADPRYKIPLDVWHLFGAINSVMWASAPQGTDIGNADFANWAGDLLQLLRSTWLDKRANYATTKAFADATIGAEDPNFSAFGRADLIQDVVGYLIGREIYITPGLSIADRVRYYFSVTGGWKTRYAEFLKLRFNGSYSVMVDTTRNMLAGDSLYLKTVRGQFMDGGTDSFSRADLDTVARSFADKIAALSLGE